MPEIEDAGRDGPTEDEEFGHFNRREQDPTFETGSQESAPRSAALMIHKELVVGPLQCNCAIVACERTREGIIIDPGEEGPRITNELAQYGIAVKYILHTHAHFDHIAAASFVKAVTSAPLCLHKADEFIYNKLPEQGRLFGFRFDSAPPIDRFVVDGEILEFGDCKLSVIHTPGHSPGGVCFHITGPGGDERLFSGDSLFAGSIGRTDLWGGNMELLLSSIRDRLFVLEKDLPVYPGHGPSTKIGIERTTNPFFN
jgi:hydroxyacylglutathione hydrolase